MKATLSPNVYLVFCLLFACGPREPQRVDAPGNERGARKTDAAAVADDTSTQSLPNTCTTDSDCVTAPYFDPAVAGGCCRQIAGPSCVAPVVTKAEAKRLRNRWEAAGCGSARCPPSASCAMGIWTPEPVCREGECMDAARPDHSPR